MVCRRLKRLSPESRIRDRKARTERLQDPEVRKKDNARRLVWLHANKDRINAELRSDPARLQALRDQKNRHARKPGVRLRNHLKKAYKLSVERYHEMIAEQGGTCAICRKPLRPGKCTHVDHDHVTGKIRGILCHPCNTSIGKLGDNAAGLLVALLYVIGDDATELQRVRDQLAQYAPTTSVSSHSHDSCSPRAQRS